MAITTNFANVTTVVRAGKAWDPGTWDFTNGGTCGALVEYAANVARITPSGLLVEEATTNALTNPRGEGSTAGRLDASGVMPTNWGTSNLTNYGEVIGTGTEDGWDYVDLKVSGTLSGTTGWIFHNANMLTVVQNDIVSVSGGIKLVGGSMSGVTHMAWRVLQRTSGGSTLGQIDGATFHTLVDSTHRRFFNPLTLTDATVGQVDDVALKFNTTGAIDFTLRIYAPQVEKKDFPTSPVLPVVATPAASTRALDDVTIPIGSWFLSSSSTVFISTKQHASFDGVVATFSDGSFAERVQMWRASSTTINLGVWNSSSQTGSVSITSLSSTIGATVDYAFALEANDLVLSTGGKTQGTDASVTLPSGLTELQLGNNFNGSLAWNGYYTDVRYWPRRLTNAELEALVGN